MRPGGIEALALRDPMAVPRVDVRDLPRGGRSMQRSSTLHGLAAVSVLASGVVAACHVDSKMNVPTSPGEPPAEPSMTETTSVAQPAPTELQAPVTSSTPPADACPLSCYEARGAEKAPLTEDEIAQLRAALEPVVSRMRQCVTADEWRSHGSPMMNLRLAPDGTLADFGLDPDEARQSPCIEDAGRGASASVSLPNRKVVRCRERCVREAAGVGRRAR
jgi:hypothetical protein